MDAEEEVALSIKDKSIPMCLRHFPTSFQSFGLAFNSFAKGNVHLMGVVINSVEFPTSRILGG